MVSAVQFNWRAEKRDSAFPPFKVDLDGVCVGPTYSPGIELWMSKIDYVRRMTQGHYPSTCYTRELERRQLPPKVSYERRIALGNSPKLRYQPRIPIRERMGKD